MERRRRGQSSLMRAGAGVLWLAIGCGASTAGAQKVVFDVSPTVACSTIAEVSTEPIAAPVDAAWDLRRVEAIVQVSTMVTVGDPLKVRECLYQFHAPERRMTVVDFSPRTTLVSDVVGNITVQESENVGKDFRLSLAGDLQDVVRADVTGARNRHQTSALQYERLPPRETLAAAGTLARGSGVYFKLRPTPQTSLEGSQEFRIVLRVPRSWRCDYLRAVCVAVDKQGRICGTANLMVPLFDERLPNAYPIAHDLLESERQLLRLAHAYQRQVRKARLPTWAHEWSLAEPRIPDDWLTQIVQGTATSATLDFETRLPQPVQVAIQSYRNAKRAAVGAGPNVGADLAVGR